MNFMAACCFSFGLAAVIARPEPPVQQPKPAGPSGRNAVPTWNFAADSCPARLAVEFRYDSVAPELKSVAGSFDAWATPFEIMLRHISPALTEFSSWIRMGKSGSEYLPPNAQSTPWNAQAE